MVFEFNYCCCCCGDLRTGSLIVGYLTLTRDGILTLASIILLSMSGSEGTKLRGTGTAAFCTLLIMAVINISFTVTMLIGIYENKKEYLKTYLIYNAVLLVISVLLVLILFIMAELAMFIPLGLFLLSIHIYYVLVIRSYYLKMDNPLKKAAIFNTPEGPPLTAVPIAGSHAQPASHQQLLHGSQPTETFRYAADTRYFDTPQALPMAMTAQQVA